MIKYHLICKNNHEFESWFSDSEEFEKLKTKGMLECIFCSSKKINKSIMAPMISGSKNKAEELNNINENLKSQKEQLVKLRKIYYDKSSEKTIYGTTTPEEREDLAEEGIDLLSIPWVDKDN